LQIFGKLNDSSIRRTAGDDYLEMLLERWRWVEGEAALAFSHHMNHLNAGQRGGSRRERFEQTIVSGS
jgi:hypothetical protein